MSLPSQEHDNENSASKKSDECFVHRVAGGLLSTHQTAHGRGLAEKQKLWDC